MSLAQSPESQAVETALRFRRAQLAHHLLSQLGTVVRHGPFLGMDLGSRVLERPHPVARVLGFELPALLPRWRQFCRRDTQAVFVGAADAHLALGLRHAGLVGRAWLVGLDQPADPAPPGIDRCRSTFPAWLGTCEPGSHLLIVVESVAVLRDWLAGANPAALAASAALQISWLWPASLAEQVPQQLQLEATPPISRWDGSAECAFPEELQGLTSTDRALLMSDSGPSSWLSVNMSSLAPRRRTLICTHAGDQFVARLLRSLQGDAFEPILVDVLHYTNPDVAGPGATPAGRAALYPEGVRAYEIDTLPNAAADPEQAAIRRFDPTARVRDAAGAFDAGATEFFDSYEQFFVWSIGGMNAEFLQWLTASYGRERVELLVSDDEVDRRWRVKQLLAGNAAATAVAARYLPPPIEQAFEAVRHFWVSRLPWESMIRFERHADSVIHPCTLPIKNSIGALASIRPPTDCYVLMLHPKPSLPRDEALAQLHRFMQNWQVDRRLRVVTLRNDMASTDLPLPDGRNVCELRVYPYPLSESMYFELMARCHGLMLVPRGGLTSIRDAVRMGLDLHDDDSAFSPNRVTLREEMGLQVLTPGPIRTLHQGWVQDSAQRRCQQRILAECDRQAVTSLRAALL
jgi:hypothetical protein